jgi:hypothetical protein
LYLLDVVLLLILLLEGISLKTVGFSELAEGRSYPTEQSLDCGSGSDGSDDNDDSSNDSFDDSDI